jgi:hypothetical protein
MKNRAASHEVSTPKTAANMSAQRGGELNPEGFKMAQGLKDGCVFQLNLDSDSKAS